MVLSETTEVPQGVTRSCAKFKRRAGTAGICGHLYETKLLSLIYFRAVHDDRVLEFNLASNVDDVGAFDDISFKATIDVDEVRKPVIVFIQAKHKENKNQTLTIDWTVYFKSYLKIKKHFDQSTKDNLLFGGTSDETECLFVIYTTARADFSDVSPEESSLISILNALIDTDGMIKQPYFQDEKVDRLCKTALYDQMTTLAENLAYFIMCKVDFQQMLSVKNDNMLRYHVILAQKVLDFQRGQQNGHRIATFRPEFFDTNEEYLIIFRDALYEEIVKRKKEPTNIDSLLSAYIAKPDDAVRLSKLIGTVITYNNNGLLEINKKYTESINRYRPQLNQEHVSRQTVNRAMELAATEIILSPEFKLKVPAAFGNKDITISKQNRIELLTTPMIKLLVKHKSDKTVIIDESMDRGFLQLHGGIAGAIGNIFVLDDDPELMKITDDVDGLGTDARSLYENLNKEIRMKNEDIPDEYDKIPNLSEYKFCFKGKKFPRLSLRVTDYEKKLAEDFLDKLLLYSNQADEKGVEDTLKDEIEEILEYSVYIQAKTNAMFLKYHNDIQTWWMLPKEAPYLTKANHRFDRASSYIIEDPLMISISVRYVRKIKQYNYTFTEDAVRSLNLQEEHPTTIIVAENIILTVLKVMQHLENKDHVVINLEDILSFETNERNALRRELTHTNIEKVIILVCDKIQMSGIEKKTFQNVAEAVRDKKTIIITNDSIVQILKSYFTNTETIISYDENTLIDMSEESQISILENALVKLDEMHLELEQLLNDWPEGGSPQQSIE